MLKLTVISIFSLSPILHLHRYNILRSPRGTQFLSK
nr:MAG TPA: hypothetical protein [Caudoviricetes sp.]